MTMLTHIRSAMHKRLAYLRTKRELESLPRDLAVEDLGIYPGDAGKIASRAVYG
jgi:uncharacterized protein YjiS (DUF1127 family)